jgi:hypothetical protein
MEDINLGLHSSTILAGRDLNPRPDEYEAGVVTTISLCSVYHLRPSADVASLFVFQRPHSRFCPCLRSPQARRVQIIQVRGLENCVSHPEIVPGS